MMISTFKKYTLSERTKSHCSRSSEDTYLGHIRDVDHLLAGRHVADDSDVQRVHDLALGRHQAVVKLCVFMHIKQSATREEEISNAAAGSGAAP